MVNDSTVGVFDDERAVANSGLMLPGRLAQRLGIEQLVRAGRRQRAQAAARGLRVLEC